ncbi:DUF5990 family protein [Sphaerisporangium sp. TRM90804]|uniref:DUF5990 family protein n=1 Tax=Sphaerisporangium sp. TRM90804 TaxID=3031113 RepID=UPI0024474318|nr:DUF5990 family protein [Sphaerisporangium sp. TRM90804]MDH2428189.1 DUF5990 family protein [Sphaerisporangium sp. TRM90804]
MLIRIEGFDLPGRVCEAGRGFPGYRDIHVGVQHRDRRKAILEPHPGDASSAAWTLECAAVQARAGVDFKGPYIQGRPGERFVYLSWGSLVGDGVFASFRRAKLMLDALEPAVVDEAVEVGTLLGRVGLTDREGRPLCASVRPPAITWTAGPG